MPTDNLGSKTRIYWTTLSTEELKRFRQQGFFPVGISWGGGFEESFANAYLKKRVIPSITSTTIDLYLKWGADYALVSVKANMKDFAGSGGEDMLFENERQLSIDEIVIGFVANQVKPLHVEGYAISDEVKNYFAGEVKAA